ncbi:MAG: acetyl-CoA carboxylase, carboxyltransferase subunit beta [Planctomycetota bacterium]
MAWSFRKKREIPAGLWTKCTNAACGKMAFSKTIQENVNVCPECSHHMRLEARRRVDLLLDAGTFQPIGDDIVPVDVLRFNDGTEAYEQKLKRTRAKGQNGEAALAGRGTMGGRPVVLAVLDFSFLGGSMGVVVGERVALAAEAALKDRVPLIVVSSSGGARMHEGPLSLMQMAKTSAAIARLRPAKIPYISVLADPCTGGVSASFAAQGDLTLAEPGALIGFAGPRVIESTIRTTLPEGFQRAEFLAEKGFIDRIVDRRKLREEILSILAYLAPLPEQPLLASATAGEPTPTAGLSPKTA